MGPERPEVHYNSSIPGVRGLDLNGASGSAALPFRSSIYIGFCVRTPKHTVCNLAFPSIELVVVTESIDILY